MGLDTLMNCAKLYWVERRWVLRMCDKYSLTLPISHNMEAHSCGQMSKYCLVNKLLIKLYTKLQPSRFNSVQSLHDGVRNVPKYSKESSELDLKEFFYSRLLLEGSK